MLFFAVRSCTFSSSFTLPSPLLPKNWSCEIPVCVCETLCAFVYTESHRNHFLPWWFRVQLSLAPVQCTVYMLSRTCHFHFKPICNCVFLSIKLFSLAQSAAINRSAHSVQFTWSFLLVVAVRVLYHFLNLNCHRKSFIWLFENLLRDWLLVGWYWWWRAHFILVLSITHLSLSMRLFLAIYFAVQLRLQFVLLYLFFFVRQLFMPWNDTKSGPLTVSAIVWHVSEGCLDVKYI